MKKLFFLALAFFIIVPQAVFGERLYLEENAGKFVEVACDAGDPTGIKGIGGCGDDTQTVTPGGAPFSPPLPSNQQPPLAERLKQLREKYEKIIVEEERKRQERERKPLTRKQVQEAVVRVMGTKNGKLEGGSAVALGMTQLNAKDAARYGHKYVIYFGGVHHVFEMNNPRGEFFKSDAAQTKIADIPLRVITYDKDQDIALAYGFSDEPMPIARLADENKKTQIGDCVVGIGCPGFTKPIIYSPSDNKIIARDIFVTEPTSPASSFNIVTSKQSQPGASGGPLIDKNNDIIAFASSAHIERCQPSRALGVKECAVYASASNIHSLLKNNPHIGLTIKDGHIVPK